MAQKADLLLFLPMETQDLWDNLQGELYFFILKSVKDKNAANDIFQNTFLKIHKHLPQLKKEDKAKAWAYQIARNEITDHLAKASRYVPLWDNEETTPQQDADPCCFDRFINGLPHPYKEVITLVYIKGQKQKEAAQTLGISLENVKIRIRRAKDILKKNFKECCKFELDEKGRLKGEPNCAVCNTE